MIKRPMVLILVFYLTGECLAWLNASVILIALILLLIILFIFFLNFHSHQKALFRRDRILWYLPLFLLLGFLVTREQLQEPDVYASFDREVSCELSGRVEMLVNKKDSQVVYLDEVMITLSQGEKYTCGKVIVYPPKLKSGSEVASREKLLVGNRILVKGSLQKFQKATNPGQFDENFYYQTENIDFKIYAETIAVIDSGFSYYHYQLGRIKSKLVQVYTSLLTDQEAGAMTAMLLGEKYLLTEEIKELYQQNGISHLLAISGLHVTLIGMFIFRLLKKLKVPLLPVTLITIFFVYSYGVLTNFSVSANRSVVMMVLFLLAAPVGKTYDILSALSLSAFLILLQNPMQLFSAGFLLSYSALIGITVIYPRLKHVFPSDHFIVNSLLISTSAQIATTPVILWFYYQYPTYSVLMNLLILPFVTILTLTSILAGIAGAIYLPAGVFFIGGASYILRLYEWICRIGSRLPGNLITVGQPDRIRILLYVILTCWFLWAVKKQQKKYPVLLLAAATLMILQPYPDSGLKVTFLDVGQGDAIYMESATGTGYLIDGGSADLMDVGKYRLEPFLLSQGKSKIDYAIVTHSDDDHISGLVQLLSGSRISVGTMLLPGISREDEAYQELERLARDKGIKISYCNTGDILEDGKLTLYCLHPGVNYIPSSTNSYSTVFGVTYEEFDMLLTGDLQKDGEEQVVNLMSDKNSLWEVAKPPSDYEVLKVSHHGSKNSTTKEFLAAIDPEIAVISCGEDNFYGHPHRELLDRLEQAGCDIRITYRTGAVTIQTDGQKLLISNYRTD